jgi:hypothetical protein
MRSFSSLVIEAPGDCSPSRKVVSKMIKESDIANLLAEKTKPAEQCAGRVAWTSCCAAAGRALQRTRGSGRSSRALVKGMA